ncbi:MAG: PAS domain-containing protein [Anaerolineae bacterium]|nr:PAS domain-containing protein [Anaerolineae bacterium]
MQAHMILSMLALLAGAVAAAVLARLASARRPAPGALPFMVFALGLAAWLLCYALGVASVDFAARLFWIKMLYVGVTATPAAWLVFSVAYTGRQAWLTRRNLALLAVHPALTLIAVWTNEQHNLFWSATSFDASDPAPLLAVARGPLYWVHFVYCGLLLLAGGLLLTLHAARAASSQPWQSNLGLLGGAVIAMVSVAVALPASVALGLIPLALVVIAVAVYGSTFHTFPSHHLTDIVPTAHAAVVEGMDDAVIVLDAQCHIVAMNPAATALLGKAAADAIGRPAAKVLPAGDVFEQCCAPTETDTEITLETGMGPQHLELHTSLLYQGAHCAGRLVVLRDITERRQIEEAFNEERSLLRAVLDHLPDGVHIKDRESRFMLANQEVLYGVGAHSMDEVIGKTDADFFPPELAAQYYADEQEIMRSGKPMLNREEPTITQSTGEKKVLLTTKAPLRDNQGEVIGLIGISRDITERKRAEEALRASEARYRLLLEAMSDSVFVLDADWRCIVVNEAATRLTQRPREELIGETMTDAVPGIEQTALFETCQRVMQTRTPETVEESFTVEDGRVVWFEVNVYPVPEGIMCVGQDVTARKEAEAALQRHNAKLRAQNEELDAFAHTVAHDLKNPLSYLLGFAEIFAEDYGTLAPSEIEDGFHIIANSALKANNIIDELLLLAGVRKLDITPAPVDMAAIVDDALARLAPQVTENQAEIVMPDSATWPVALGYGPWLEEVWVNYISNAIKHGGQPPRVELGATPLDGAVRFWVRDNGIGISSEDQKKLFVPFTRVGQVRPQGHGLGLSIVRRIVEKLGGKVAVESAPGEGSVFSFTLPASAGPGGAVTGQNEDPGAPAAAHAE